MAKLTKSELKSVFKEAIRECLQEIVAENSQLAEALTPKKPKIVTETKKVSSAESKKRAQELVSKAMADDNPENSPRIENPALIETVDSVVGSMSQYNQDKTGDMMRNILTDTAATTLQEQREIGGNAAGLAMGSTSGTPEVDIESLKELSHDGDIKRWAQVALAKK